MNIQFGTERRVLPGKVRAKGDNGAVRDDDSIDRINVNFYLLWFDFNKSRNSK